MSPLRPETSCSAAQPSWPVMYLGSGSCSVSECRRRADTKCALHCREICEETGDAAFLLSYNKKLLDLLQKQPSAQKARLAGDVARDLFHAGARCLEVEDHRNAKCFFAAAQGPLTAAEQVRLSSFAAILWGRSACSRDTHCPDAISFSVLVDC